MVDSLVDSEEELGLESRSLNHLCVSRIPVDNRRVVRPYSILLKKQCFWRKP